MSPVPGPSYYDVLDVEPTATTDEIREAWRAATADLTPADRRFRLYSQAAEVLLDADRRAAYDAELAAAADSAGEPGPGEESAPPAAPTVTAPTAPTAPSGAAGPLAALGSVGSVIATPARRWLRSREERPPRADDRPGWPLLALAVVTLLSVALTGYLLTQPSSAAVDDAAAEARSAAERAIVPVLSYDHDTLDADQQAAHRYLTDDYRAEYDRFFDGVVRKNARRTRATVDVTVVSSGVVRATEDHAEVLLFVNRPTTNKSTDKPVVYKDQVRVRLDKVGDEWLVDCLVTTAEGRCRS